MQSCCRKVTKNGFLGELLAGFQAVEPFDQDETVAILPHHDRRLLPDLKYALSDLACLAGSSVARSFAGT
jgi:hypothetical protein